ncbi:hypothetical protein AHAS_Ahas11G0090200 [Arachis hypogaea]
MAGQSGGYGMLRFTKQDLYNYVHGKRVARICDGNAATTFSYLEGKANANMRTTTRYTRASDNHLSSLFWADGKKKSCVVVTNGDKSMRVAIAKVMPTTTHRLYGWHLEKNCVQRVKETEFCKVFRKAIYAKFEINDFEEYWKASVECLALGSVHA